MLAVTWGGGGSHECLAQELRDINSEHGLALTIAQSLPTGTDVPTCATIKQ